MVHVVSHLNETTFQAHFGSLVC